MKGNDMPPKHRWSFYLLWPNLSVAVVVLVQIAGNQISSAGQLARVLVYSLIYANLVTLLALLLIGVLAGRWVRRALTALILCFVVVIPVGALLVQTLLFMLGLVVPQHFWLEYWRTLRVGMPLALLFGLGAWFHMSLRGRVQVTEEKLREKELAEERARKLATEARLHLLESRIHPHFLFNTLNSISSLIAVKPALAEQTVGRLAGLLRASLDNSNQALIPLRQELALVSNYMDIEKVRFGDKLRVSIDVPADMQDAMVPPMSVQALVENAVKHGIVPQSGGGEVFVAASVENGSLRIEVRDTGPGFDLSAVPAGHGLDNLVERLNALFGAKARVNVLPRDGYSAVELVVPYETSCVPGR